MYDDVELWTTDEHRIGLKPILKRIWAPKDQRPVIRTYPSYEWLYLYAFVQPETGKSIWYLWPEMNARAFQLVLANFATAVKASPKKHILLVLDNASSHTSSKLVLPQGIEAIFQPSLFARTATQHEGFGSSVMSSLPTVLPPTLTT